MSGGKAYSAATVSAGRTVEALEHTTPELLTFLDPGMCDGGVRRIKLANAPYEDYRNLMELLSTRYKEHAGSAEGFSPLPKDAYTKLLDRLPARVTEEMARCSAPSSVTVEVGDLAELHHFSMTHRHMPPGYVFLATSKTENLGYIVPEGLAKPDNSFIRSTPVIVLSEEVVREAGKSKRGFNHLVEVATHELAHGILATTEHPKHLGLLQRHSLNDCVVKRMGELGVICTSEETRDESAARLLCQATNSINTQAMAEGFTKECTVDHPARIKEGDCGQAKLMTDIACQEDAAERIETAYKEKEHRKRDGISAYSIASTAAATCFRTSMRHYVIPACSDHLVANGHLKARNRRRFDEAAIQAVEVASHMMTAGGVTEGLIQHTALTAVRFVGKRLGLSDSIAEGMVKAASATFSEGSLQDIATSAAVHGATALTAGSITERTISRLPKLRTEDEPTGIRAAAMRQQHRQGELHRRR